ncbi:MAG: hypothetical protein HQ505_02050 [Nitrosopumilus sp.]|nr:hypothetical protein [Nitrosopumilus sp.]
MTLVVVYKSNDDVDIELECEEKIISEKHRFGRVRSMTMSQLREEYGNKIANRSLARINKRISIGSKMTKIHSDKFLM